MSVRPGIHQAFHMLFNSDKAQTGPRTAGIESETVIAYGRAYRFFIALHRNLNRRRFGMTGQLVSASFRIELTNPKKI